MPISAHPPIYLKLPYCEHVLYIQSTQNRNKKEVMSILSISAIERKTKLKCKLTINQYQIQ